MAVTAVRIEVRPDGVAVLTIDQPDARVNVLTPALWSDLDVAIESVAQRPDIRGLVVASGKPGVFIAGADLKLLATASPGDPAVQAVIDQGLRVLEKLESLPFPTCAAIDGAALGGGLEVALACDYRLAGANPKVKFGLPELTLGLIPGWGGTQRLPRLIDAAHVVPFLLSAEEHDADKAQDRGLVEDVVPSERLIDAAAELTLDAQASGAWRGSRDEKRGPIRGLPLAAFDMHRASITRNFGPDNLTRAAAIAVIDVLEAGSKLGLDDAIPVETAAFLRLAGSDESRRLIADFFTRRKK